MSGGAIAGAVIGSLIGVVLIAGEILKSYAVVIKGLIDIFWSEWGDGINNAMQGPLSQWVATYSG